MMVKNLIARLHFPRQLLAVPERMRGRVWTGGS